MVKIELKKILESPFFSELQDQFAVVTGLSFSTVDPTGRDILSISSCTPFCKAIRDNPNTFQRCETCHALAGLEALHRNRPLIYQCHCGIVEVAVPIHYEHQHLGSIIFGQVLLSEEDADIQPDPLIWEHTEFSEFYPQKAEELAACHAQLHRAEYGQLLEIADLVNMIVFYIIHKDAAHQSDRLAYEWMLNNGTYPQAARDQGKGDSTMALPADPLQDLPVDRNSVVYPAVRYIHRHPKERISMQAMANLCHLSTSYFSRVFLRDVGENFNDYLNHHKILRIKELLLSSDLSIAAIAASFGFRDTSYFTKVFKKYTNMTPQEWKNNG